MKAAGLYGIKDIQIVDLEMPVLNPGDVLMKVEVATTCGTDLKTYMRGYPGKEFPLVPWGHEGAGVVEQIGDGVTKFNVGDRIAFSGPAPCLKCYFCKRNRADLCEDLVSGTGVYAEYFRIPARIVDVNAFKIPDNITFEQACLLEPLSSTVQGFMRAGGGRFGDRVVVIGAGAQGLGHIQLARLSGAIQVIAIDMIDTRLQLAEELGATHIINAGSMDAEQEVRKLTDGRGCDLVIEAVGTVQTWESAIRMARKGGTVLEYGGCAKGTSFTMDTGRLHYDGLTITGCTHKTPEYVEMAWNLIISETLKTKPLVTSEFKLEDIREAYRSLETEKKEIKIAIRP